MSLGGFPSSVNSICYIFSYLEIFVFLFDSHSCDRAECVAGGVSWGGECVEGGSVLSQSVLRGECFKGGVSNGRECLTSECLTR